MLAALTAEIRLIRPNFAGAWCVCPWDEYCISPTFIEIINTSPGRR